MKDVIVFARSYSEFKFFCNREVAENSKGLNVFKSEERYIYPDRIENILGLKNPSIVLYGSWYENKTMKKAYEECKKRYHEKI